MHDNSAKKVLIAGALESQDLLRICLYVKLFLIENQWCSKATSSILEYLTGCKILLCCPFRYRHPENWQIFYVAKKLLRYTSIVQLLMFYIFIPLKSLKNNVAIDSCFVLVWYFVSYNKSFECNVVLPHFSSTSIFWHCGTIIWRYLNYYLA